VLPPVESMYRRKKERKYNTIREEKEEKIKTKEPLKKIKKQFTKSNYFHNRIMSTN
jgi:hypothetical protein